MLEVKEHPPGSFSWADLATSDPEGAKAFYAGLFGWNATDYPAGEGMTYTMFDKNGLNSGATYKMSDEMKGQGIPPHWSNYVTVVSADESQKRVEELGGKIDMAAFDVMDVGRMTVMQDPQGAHLALWEPKGHIGPQIANEPGSMCWNELATSDMQAAAAFYSELFGWQASKMPPMNGIEYTMLIDGETPKAGMMLTPEEWGGAPPMWNVYFLVEDINATMQKVEGLGGKGVTPVIEVEIGKFAFVRDPQHAYFGIFEAKQG